MLLNCKSFLTYIISCSAFGFYCSGRWMKSKEVLPKLMLSGYWLYLGRVMLKCYEMWNVAKRRGFSCWCIYTMPIAAIVLVFSLQIDCDWGWSLERPGDEAQNWLKTWSLSHSNIHTISREQRHKILTSVDMFQYYSINNNSSSNKHFILPRILIFSYNR